MGSGAFPIVWPNTTKTPKARTYHALSLGLLFYCDSGVFLVLAMVYLVSSELSFFHNPNALVFQQKGDFYNFLGETACGTRNYR